MFCVFIYLPLPVWWFVFLKALCLQTTCVTKLLLLVKRKFFCFFHFHLLLFVFYLFFLSISIIYKILTQKCWLLLFYNKQQYFWFSRSFVSFFLKAFLCFVTRMGYVCSKSLQMWWQIGKKKLLKNNREKKKNTQEMLENIRKSISCKFYFTCFV